MSVWTARDKSLTFDQLKTEAGKAQKDQHLVIIFISFCNSIVEYVSCTCTALAHLGA